MQSTAELEDKIFTQYQESGDAGALPDGLTDPSQYAQAKFKMIFILKEAHGWNEETDYPRDLRRFAYDGGTYKTWGNLAHWSSFANDTSFQLDDLDATDPAARAEKLRSCGFVNLKKVPGGTSSNSSEIDAFAKAHGILLREQLALYKPDVTISCGAFATLRDLYGVEQQDAPAIQDGFCFFKHPDLGTVIDFYHPQYLGKSPNEYLAMLRLNLSHHFPQRFNKESSAPFIAASPR